MFLGFFGKWFRKVVDFDFGFGLVRVVLVLV